MSRPGDAPNNAKHAMLDSFEQAGFPTWTFWGKTTVHMYNTGDCHLTALVQAGAAPPEMVGLDAGEDHLEFGYWGGFKVFITNATQRDDATNQEPQLEVWVW